MAGLLGGLASFAVAGALGAPLARADTPPTGWDRARDPSVGPDYKLHLHVQEFLLPPGEVPSPVRSLLLERARSELEANGAATSPDVRLRFDLGEAYYGLERYEEALTVLKAALALAPDASDAARAWSEVAFSAAHLDRSREELDAYDAFLRVSRADGFGGDALDIRSNRAEAEMRLGQLDLAVEGYRDVIFRIENSAAGAGAEFETLVLARWGLSVALDRNGDPAGAEHEASLAADEDPDEHFIGDYDHVFFVPPYERDWYYALGRTAHARRAPDAQKAAEAWTKVALTWSDYVHRAAPNDRWVPLARAHLASAEAERAAAIARLPPGKRAAFPPKKT